MSLANAVAVAGTVIRAAQHNALVYLLDGVAGYGDAVSLDQYSSAATPALTVRNLHASGTALQVQDSAGTSVLAVTSDAVTVNEPLVLSSSSSWPPLIRAGYDTSSQGSQSQSARTTSSDTVKRVQIQHGTMGAPFVNNNGTVNYPSFDFYGPASSMTFMSRQRPVSNNCLYDGVSVMTHIPDDSLWEWVFDSRITADASANNPMGMSGIYGLVARSTADKQMKGVTTCKHGAAGADPQTYYRNALTAITRTEGTDNSAVATFYAEGTMNTTAVLSPYANVKAAEITVRQGISTATPADDAPAFGFVGIGQRYLYGIALEMGRESASAGRYGTVGLYIAGDSGSIDGSWRSGIIFGRSSCLEFGIDFHWVNSAAPGSPGVLPSGGLIRLANAGWVTARNNADNNNVNVIRVVGASDAVQLQNGVVNIDAAGMQVTGIHYNTGTAYIGETTNADVTLGLTINQGAADDQILALKSSDVAHGVTTLAETDTYGYARKFAAADGGLHLTGLADTGAVGLYMRGGMVTADTGKNATSTGAVVITGALKSGTGTAVLGANGNILAVQNNGSGSAAGTVFLVDAEGNILSDDTASTYDAYDDLAMCRALDYATNPAAVIANEFDRFLTHSADDLVRAGILHPSDTPEGKPFVSWTRLAKLHNGALSQVSARLQRIERQLAALPSAH